MSAGDQLEMGACRDGRPELEGRGSVEREHRWSEEHEAYLS